jgi:cytosine/adenosine deaminase-related metal-dependent hydrolase
LGTTQDFIRVHTVVANTPAQPVTYKTAVEQGRGFIYHLCEGSDPGLLEEYTLVEGVGLVHRLLLAIHGSALGQPQLDALAGVGATLVWSPFSNLWLYGQTAAIGQAKASGLRLCLGSAAVGYYQRAVGAEGRRHLEPRPTPARLHPQELCELVTANPATRSPKSGPAPSVALFLARPPTWW